MRQLEESDARTDRICFYFSDFVLHDPGDKPSVENYDNRENGRRGNTGRGLCLTPGGGEDLLPVYEGDSVEGGGGGGGGHRVFDPVGFP